MFDLRYHIVSLVAVFLALTLGIVLGSSIAEKGVIEQGRKAAFDKLVNSIKGDISDLQNENTELKADLRQLDLVSQGTYKALTIDVLKDKNFLLITSADTGSSAAKDAKKAVADAGGSLFEFKYLGVGERPVYAEIAKVIPGITLGSGDIDALVRDQLFTTLQGSGDPKLVQVLVENKVIEIEKNVQTPISGLIIDWNFGKGSPRVSTPDLAMIESFQDGGQPVVGVEISGTKNSLVPLYREFQIDSVDNVDKVSGKLSLIYVLLGQTGHYGESRTAQALMPPLTPVGPSAGASPDVVFAEEQPE